MYYKRSTSISELHFEMHLFNWRNKSSFLLFTIGMVNPAVAINEEFGRRWSFIFLSHCLVLEQQSIMDKRTMAERQMDGQRIKKYISKFLLRITNGRMNSAYSHASVVAIKRWSIWRAQTALDQCNAFLFIKKKKSILLYFFCVRWQLKTFLSKSYKYVYWME